MDPNEVRAIAREAGREAAVEALEHYRKEDDTWRWARDQIQRELDRRAMWKKVRDSVLGQVVLYVTIGLGYAIWTAVKRELSK